MAQFHITCLVDEAHLGSVMATVMATGTLLDCHLVKDIPAPSVTSKPPVRQQRLPRPGKKKVPYPYPSRKVMAEMMPLIPEDGSVVTRRTIQKALQQRGFKVSSIDSGLAKAVQQKMIDRPEPGLYRKPIAAMGLEQLEERKVGNG